MITKFGKNPIKLPKDFDEEKELRAYFEKKHFPVTGHEPDYTPELKHELDKRVQGYKQGLIPAIPAKESKSRIQAILSSFKKRTVSHNIAQYKSAMTKQPLTEVDDQLNQFRNEWE